MGEGERLFFIRASTHSPFGTSLGHPAMADGRLNFLKAALVPIFTSFFKKLPAAKIFLSTWNLHGNICEKLRKSMWSKLKKKSTKIVTFLKVHSRPSRKSWIYLKRFAVGEEAGRGLEGGRTFILNKIHEFDGFVKLIFFLIPWLIITQLQITHTIRGVISETFGTSSKQVFNISNHCLDNYTV